MLTYSQKITFADMRASGVRDVLIYCRDHRCSHHIEISADRWPGRGGPRVKVRAGMRNEYLFLVHPLARRD